MRMRSGPSWWRRWSTTGLAVLVGTGLTLAGCSDSTGPDEVFDPVVANTAADEVFEPFNDNVALEAIDVLSDAFPSFASGAPAMAPPDAELPSWFGGRLGLLQRIAPFRSPAEPAAIFPADLLGRTLVYDVELARYVVGEGTGAPENGVRLILYAVDPILHQPVTPLNDIGYLDLTDESTPAADRIGILAVVNQVTYLDYAASAVLTTSSITFSAEGYLSDGTTVVDFTLSHSWSQEAGFSVSYDVSERNTDNGVQLSLNLDPATQTGTMGLTVTYGGNTLTFSGTGSDTAIEGTVSYNGQTVVEVSGSPDAPVFTDVAGNELTPAQLQALAEIFHSIGEILDGFDDLLKPAYAVFSVAIFSDL